MSNLMKEEDEMKKKKDTSHPLKSPCGILKKKKNGIDRNSSYNFCEKQIVSPVLKFYSVKTE